jgi:hypothetical protein
VKRALPYLLFAAISLACFWRFLFLGWTLYDIRALEGHLGTAPAPAVDRGDTVLVLPMLQRLYSEGLHRGELRLWNPYLFCGYPLYSDHQIHPFYPPNLAFHALLPYRGAYDLNLLLHFFFSGAAMYWLLRGSGRSPFAATLGGALWMLLGYNTHWISTGILMGASVFAPLALLGIQTGLARRDLRPLAQGGLAQGLVLLGSHGQHALHLMIFFSAWLAVSWIRDPEARRFILKGGAIFVGASLGVGAAAILTQLDSISNGLRVPGEDLGLHYASPWILPLYMSGVAAGKVLVPSDDLIRSEFTIYAGVAASLLAVLGAVRGFRDPWIRFLAIFAVATLLVAFLKPLAELLLLIPGLNLGMPARWLYVFGFCLVPLAASGVDALREDPSRTLRPLAAGGVVCLALLLVRIGHGAWIESLVGAALAAAWLVSAGLGSRFSPALCLAAILIDLLPNFMAFNRHADPAPLERPVAEISSLPRSEPWRGAGNLRLGGAPESMRPWTFLVGQNLLALHGVEAPLGYEAIAPLSAAQYCLLMNGGKGVMGSGRVLAVLRPESRLLDLANVKYFFMAWPEPPAPGYRKSGASGSLSIWENPHALPRAYLASHALKASDENEAAGWLQSKDFDPRTTVVLQTSELPRTAEGGGGVSWTWRDSDRIELSVDAKADALLVVSDTDYPGWEASVDGVATPILRANLAFRAVAVPGGKHQVTMRFRPRSARVGLILSTLSLAGLLARCSRRKRSSS